MNRNSAHASVNHQSTRRRTPDGNKQCILVELRVTSFTSLNIRANSSLMDRLRLSMSPRRFLLERKLFSVKNTDSAFRASSISWKNRNDMKTGSQAVAMTSYYSKVILVVATR